jgi:hypothetical protein
MIGIIDYSSAESVADWVELVILTEGISISRTQLASEYEASSGSEPPEEFISDVWCELSYRQRMFEHAPFSVEDSTIDPSPVLSVRPEYLACVLLSVYGVPSSAQYITDLFEQVTRSALEVYTAGQAIVVGWHGVDGEQAIADRIKKIANTIGERFCEPPQRKYKDRGVDVAGWRPFNDSRSGKVVLLVQCAAGRHWKDKLPVPLDAWCEYIHWACRPISGFAVPCVVGRGDWHDYSKDKGLLLDRVRIANLLYDRKIDNTLFVGVAKWVSYMVNLVSQV